jgi:hypothetical protein
MVNESQLPEPIQKNLQKSKETETELSSYLNRETSTWIIQSNFLFPCYVRASTIAWPFTQCEDEFENIDDLTLRDNTSIVSKFCC